MRKTYRMFLALLLSVLCTSAYAVTADLDPAMFKAWDGAAAGAKEVAEPAECPNSDGTTSPFGCDYNMFKELGTGEMVYGNTNVYALWYADITGTKTLTIEGTPGMQLRILINRPVAEEGAQDPHGGQTTEINVTLDDKGVGVVDFTQYEFVHLNGIKTGWSSPKGSIRLLELEGSVKPVTGWLDMINNGDAEGDDLESFPVSKNGPTTSTAADRPEIVAGGVEGNCFKVVSDDNATETWSTQFFLKFNEFLPEGTQWRLSMQVRADRDAVITSSAQAAPRAWQGGFIEQFSVTDQWQKFEFSGTVDAGQAGSAGMGSAAFDLNNDKDISNTFYFDNIEFQIYKEKSAIGAIATTYGADVIRIGLGSVANIADLVKAGGSDRIIYPNANATVTWNGKQCNVLSVEGRPDGNLYIFLDDMDGEGGSDFEADDAQVIIGFTNPEDAALRIVYKGGKNDGQPLPDFSGLICTYDDELAFGGEYFSYLWGAPVVESADPESGSFGLPADTKTFKITFNQEVKVNTVKAVLGNENLTVAPAEGLSREITLTRTGSDALNGVYELTITSATGERDLDIEENIVLPFSFGDVEIDPNDQPEDLLPDYFSETDANNFPKGYAITFGGEVRTTAMGGQGSGPRMFAFAEGGECTRALYFREGSVTYGKTDYEGKEEELQDYVLTLKGGKKYHFRFNAFRWKDNGTKMTFKILNDAEEELFSEDVTPTFNADGKTGIVVSGTAACDFVYEPEADGNYILKWIADGFTEVMLANPSVKYVPNVLGIEETEALAAALDKAKIILNSNSDERYLGAAYNALDALIKEYEGKKMTAPSAYAKAVADLDAAGLALTNHHKLCDSYDALPQQAVDQMINYANSKFNGTELYGKLTAAVAKYCTVEKQEITDENGETTVQDVLVDFVKPTDDAELQAAMDELSSVVNSVNTLFTVGFSAPENAWGGKATGVAVLTDRLRLGAEALKSLGRGEDDALVVAAVNALTDDDALAEQIQKNLKKDLYEQMKDPANTLFEGVTDETTLETVTPTYDMTVFVKNPNIYKQQPNMNFTPDNIPGWVVPEGFKAPGLTVGWGSAKNIEGVAEDCMFQTWGGDYRVEQTVTNLPAGVYTITMGFGERQGAANGNDITEEIAAQNLAGSFIYAKTSDTPVAAEGEEEQFAGIAEAGNIGQAFPTLNLKIENVVVTDGVLTIGANGGSSSHTFFNDVRVAIAGAAEGFDYGKAYEEAVLAGVDAAKTAKVKAIELYDLNGQRIPVAKKGIFLMKKYLSDGTVETVKVIK